MLLTALAVLAGNMFAPSLPHIARDFEVDYAVANIAIAGYLAITAVLQAVNALIWQLSYLLPSWLVGPALLLLFVTFGTVSFQEVFSEPPAFTSTAWMFCNCCVTVSVPVRVLAVF